MVDIGPNLLTALGVVLAVWALVRGVEILRGGIRIINLKDGGEE